MNEEYFWYFRDFAFVMGVEGINQSSSRLLNSNNLLWQCLNDTKKGEAETHISMRFTKVVNLVTHRHLLNFPASLREGRRAVTLWKILRRGSCPRPGVEIECLVLCSIKTSTRYTHGPGPPLKVIKSPSARLISARWFEREHPTLEGVKCGGRGVLTASCRRCSDDKAS